MKRKTLCIMLLAVFMIFGPAACGKNEDKPVDEPEVKEQSAEAESEVRTTRKSKKPDGSGKGRPTAESEESVADPEGISFKDFAGDYYFSSGAGGWSTDVTIFEDGSFTGAFHDSDMGDSDTAYPNGIVYLCEFNGKFTKLEKKDDFTYTCSLEEITQEEEEGKEEISQKDGIKYVYSYPYGFDDAKDFEFYLPGKSVGDCTQEFLSWMSLRYNDPYPDTLFYKAFNNLSAMQGFQEAEEYVEGGTAEYPESLPLDEYELAGSYTNKNLGITLNISVYTSDLEEGEACGNISWDIPEDVYIWNDEALLFPSDNGFDVKLEFYGEYKIIVTDSTSEKVVIHLYDAMGRDCGEYIMTEHFVS